MTLLIFVEFNLSQNIRERKSCPPLKFTGIKAREMPDFSKIAFKRIKDSGELTIP